MSAGPCDSPAVRYRNIATAFGAARRAYFTRAFQAVDGRAMQPRHVSARIPESCRQLDDRCAVQMDGNDDLSLERREGLQQPLYGQPVDISSIPEDGTQGSKPLDNSKESTWLRAR